MAAPTPTVAGSEEVCEGSISAYSVAPVPGDTYNWVVTNGVIITGDGTSNVTIEWTTDGVGSVEVVQGTVQGCAENDVLLVTVNATPEPVITYPSDLICTGDPAMTLDAGVGFATYQWCSGCLLYTSPSPRDLG